jgi:DNA-binding CsgD family transcriptional regulator
VTWWVRLSRCTLWPGSDSLMTLADSRLSARISMEYWRRCALDMPRRWQQRMVPHWTRLARRSTGATLLAAEASAAASRCWRDIGHERKAAASERKELAELRACENPRGVVALISPSIAQLTPGQLRIAMSAATGRSSRQIADEFVVSIRTVQNQLQRVYEKLGIRSRSELSRALADYEG